MLAQSKIDSIGATLLLDSLKDGAKIMGPPSALKLLL